jgi:protocatechuate 3,4-dioxygenase beta subunit
MSASTPPSNKRRPILILLAAAIFALLVAGSVVWIIQSLWNNSSSQTIVLQNLPSNAAPPLSTPTGPGGTQMPVQARPASGPAIGGLVQNEQGGPINNVHVFLMWRMPGQAQKTSDLHTDNRGRWGYDGIPQEALSRLRIRVSQKDYATKTFPPVAVDQLLSHSLILTMSHGVDVTGTVVDESGKPLAGVYVTTRTNWNNATDTAPHATTDGDGHFTIRRQVPGNTVPFTATLAGHAPAVSRVKIAAKNPPLTLTLGHGRTIHGKVTDKSGQPMAGVSVYVNQWEQMFRPFGAGVTTDHDGNYRLADLPTDQIAIEADKNGYTNGFTYVPDQASNTQDFVMSPLLTIRGRVIDAATKEPVENFKVITGARWSGEQAPSFSAFAAKAFTNGQYNQTLTGYSGNIDAWFLRVEARGYLPAVSPPLNDSGTQDFELQKGHDLIGRVLDENGNPVAGESLAVAMPGGNQLLVYDGQFTSQPRDNQTPVTGIDGRFDLPPQVGTYIVVAVGPTGYAEADQDALTTSTDLHLKRWGRIEGKLLVGGKPAADESIDGNETGQIYDPQKPNVRFEINGRTDADGHFTLDYVPAGQISVSRMVQAPGRNFSTSAQSEMATVEPGKTTTVSLGGHGRPVIGRLAFPAELNGRQDFNVNMYGQPKNPSDDAMGVSALVDTDGTFRFEDVRPGTYTVNINVYPDRGGENLATGTAEFTVPLIAGGVSDKPLEIPTIVLKAPLQAPMMSGKVVDANTHQPIAAFRVLSGARWSADQVPFFTAGAGAPFTLGAYSLQLSGFGGNIDAWFVRIEAKGYKPADSPALRDSGTQDFALEPGKDIQGRVLDAEGKPVAGASIAVGTQMIQLNNGALQGASGKTETDGRFDLPPQSGNFYLAVAGPGGYAIADEDEIVRSADLHLTPWGRIEGTLLMHGKPAANESIQATRGNSPDGAQPPRMFFNYNTTTDAQGRFVLDSVPPGKVSVSRTEQTRFNGMFPVETEVVTVTSGKTSTVTIGGAGRPVTGRVEVPVNLPAGSDQFSGSVSEKNHPSDHYFAVEVNEDHSFRIEDVKPGTYTIDFQMANGNADGSVTGSADFTVPPVPAGYTNQPLELPTIKLSFIKAPEVGDLVPELAATTVDGQQFKLSDYRGKYVLLSMWIYVMPPEFVATDQLKSVYEAHGTDPRFVMIGLNFDPQLADARKYVEKNQIKWQQEYLGMRGGVRKIIMGLGLRGGPPVFLIGPDGKLIARDLKAAEIKPAVDKALAK